MNDNDDLLKGQNVIMANIKEPSPAEWINTGKRIESEMERLNLNYSSLATRITEGDYNLIVSRQYVSNICRGNSFPQLYTLRVMADIFQCDTAYLLCEQDCRTRAATDIHAYTGLSEKTIDTLHEIADETPEEGKSPLYRHIIPLIDRLVTDDEILRSIARNLNKTEAYSDMECMIQQSEPGYTLGGNSADARDTAVFTLSRIIADQAEQMMRETAKTRYQEKQQRQLMNRINREIADKNVIYPAG